MKRILLKQGHVINIGVNGADRGEEIDESIWGLFYDQSRVRPSSALLALSLLVHKLSV